MFSCNVRVGDDDGIALGRVLGTADGAALGLSEGESDGASLGKWEGIGDGCGDIVGLGVLVVG